jgi:hypothetical protein
MDVRNELSMAHLENQRLGDDFTHECLICYEKSSLVLSYLICGHKFCSKCMKKYCEI